MNIYALCQSITSQLAAPEQRGIDRERDMLIELNAEQGNPAYGFILGCEFYHNLERHQLRLAERKPLHMSLMEQGLSFHERRIELGKDAQLLNQGLIKLLTPCKSLQDIRDALPNALKQFVPDIQALSRVREEAWPLKDTPQHLRLWQRTEELITLFLANRMLF